MRVLITGATGFVGRHLCRELSNHGYDLILLSNTDPVGEDQCSAGAFYKADILDRQNLTGIFRATSPDAVVHLAAVSHVVGAQNQRASLSEINIVGTHNLCAAATQLNNRLLFLFVSTALVYGDKSKKQGVELCFDEEDLPYPDSAYGSSKLAGEFLVRAFSSDQFRPYIVRPFNHIGPGQSSQFVCPGLANKIAGAANGTEVPVGNLKAYRDFMDVRDVVRAYRLILERQPKEDLFVLGSGHPIQIADIFSRFVDISGKSVAPLIDKTLFREVDPMKLYANPAKAKAVLGWEPKIDLQQTLMAVYEEAKFRSL